MSDEFSKNYWNSDNPPEIQLPSAHLTFPDGEPYFVDEMALARLLIDEVIFANSRNYAVDESGKWPGHTVVLFAICNDVFSWGCADAEDLPLNKVRELYDMHMTDRKWGSAKWCCKQRSEKPQDPVAKAMKEAGSWESWMDELKPNYYSTKCREDYERRTNQTQTRQATKDEAGI